MKIGLCGNISLDDLASELDQIAPDNEIIIGRTGDFAGELADPPADFARLDVCVVVLDWRNIVPDVYSFGHGDDTNAVLSGFRGICTEIRRAIGKFRAVCAARVLIFSPISDWRGPEGFLARLLTPSRWDLFCECQRIFNEFCRSLTDVYPVDMEEIGGRIGKETVYDPRQRIRTGYPFTPAMTRSVTMHLSAMCAQFQWPPLKCLVLDLDDTLWGGVVGETGPENLILGDAGEGMAYKELQAEIVKLYKQGVILAICSKNNTCDALDVLERHPHMLIRPSMVSCFRINWDDKPRSMIGISSELNIGLDSMMFVDDSPVEREMMRSTLPEVEVLDLPQDPAYFADALRDCTRFWPLHLSAEDLTKGKLLAQERMRRESRDVADNVERYLLTLGIHATVGRADERSLPRIAQLLNKTNQFNLTTRRHSQARLEEIVKHDRNHLLWMGLTDRFGDYGIVAAALVIDETIDSFVLSCRAFGKHAESAFLTAVLSSMRTAGRERALGEYVRSDRNSMAKDFYANAGFSQAGECDGVQRWQLALHDYAEEYPPWIAVEFVESAS